jgi:hypothetical protein
VEINPVGWMYGATKLRPAPRDAVLHRIECIAEMAGTVSDRSTCALPPFFHTCFTPAVLRFLLAAREALRWRSDQVDATVMAFILVYLHGKRPDSLSNQMRQSKAMSPEYSLRWWTERGMSPPEIDPATFLTKRIMWRYAKGTPTFADAEITLGDSTVLLNGLAQEIASGRRKHFDLLFTSPPYYSVTHYHNDQWLRLWMLGGPVRPAAAQGIWQGRFESQTAYRTLLQIVFSACASIMSEQAMVYVRTDMRAFTLETTVAALREAFPRKQFRQEPRPFHSPTQTALYGDKSEKPGEVDLILTP